jgi:hypothetical protein
MLLWLGVACGGPLEETLVDELRILGAPIDPPELFPGESASATPIVVDPVGDGFDLLVWTCTTLGPPGSPCLEFSDGGTPHIAVLREGEFTFAAPEGAGVGLAQGIEVVVGELRMLGCVPGLCPIIAQVQAGLGPPEFEVLADVNALLRAVPLEGVAYARRDLRIVAELGAPRHENPTIDVSLSRRRVRPGRSAEVAVMATSSSDAAMTAFAYTTLGGLDAVSIEIVDGEGAFEWFAPADAEPGRSHLWVIVRDERGGEAVWRGAIEVGERED